MAVKVLTALITVAGRHRRGPGALLAAQQARRAAAGEVGGTGQALPLHPPGVPRDRALPHLPGDPDRRSTASRTARRPSGSASRTTPSCSAHRSSATPCSTRCCGSSSCRRVTVVLGLAVATLADRLGPTGEKVSKTIIFLPMAISMVGAATIWRFVYYAAPAGQPQIGLQNAVLGVVRQGPGRLAAAEPVPPQQPAADGGAALVAGRLRDGAALGRRQGRAARHPGGGPHRRRQRAADLLPGRRSRRSRARSSRSSSP